MSLPSVPLPDCNCSTRLSTFASVCFNLSAASPRFASFIELETSEKSVEILSKFATTLLSLGLLVAKRSFSASEAC